MTNWKLVCPRQQDEKWGCCLYTKYESFFSAASGIENKKRLTIESHSTENHLIAAPAHPNTSKMLYVEKRQDMFILPISLTCLDF